MCEQPFLDNYVLYMSWDIPLYSVNIYNHLMLIKKVLSVLGNENDN